MFLASEKKYIMLYFACILTNKNKGKHKGKIDFKNIYITSQILISTIFV